MPIYKLVRGVKSTNSLLKQKESLNLFCSVLASVTALSSSHTAFVQPLWEIKLWFMSEKKCIMMGLWHGTDTKINFEKLTGETAGMITKCCSYWAEWLSKDVTMKLQARQNCHEKEPEVSEGWRMKTPNHPVTTRNNDEWKLDITTRNGN